MDTVCDNDPVLDLMSLVSDVPTDAIILFFADPAMQNPLVSTVVKITDNISFYLYSIDTVSGCRGFDDKIDIILNRSSDTTFFNATIQFGQVYSQYGFNEDMPGIYTQHLQNKLHCDSIVQLNLKVLADIFIDSISVHSTCPKLSGGEATIYVSGQAPPFTYLWSTMPPQTTETAYHLPQGVYTVTVTDSYNNTIIATATITAPSMGADFSVKNAPPFFIDVPIKFHNNSFGNIESYEWDFGDNTFSLLLNPEHQYADTGNYTVQLVINADNCTDTAHRNLYIFGITTCYIPNAFSPFSDVEENRIFKPVFTFPNEEDYQFSIYDRWGRLVFYTEDLNAGWDGIVRGKSVTANTVFSYVLIYRQHNQKIQKKKGSVTLIVR